MDWESLTIAILANCYFSTFQPFRVSCCTNYTISIFCDILLVHNAATGTHIPQQLQQPPTRPQTTPPIHSKTECQVLARLAHHSCSASPVSCCTSWISCVMCYNAVETFLWLSGIYTEHPVHSNAHTLPCVAVNMSRAILFSKTVFLMWYILLHLTELRPGACNSEHV